MVEKSQDKEMNKSVAVGNVENNSEIAICSIHFPFLGVRQTVRTVNDLFSPSHEG